jgi:PilZ domain
MISRHCDRCKETTRWVPSQQTGMPEILESKPQRPGAQTEKRRAKRIKLMMRIRVRNAWGIVDVAQTRDVSKLGLCFLSAKLFTLGEEVFVILPFSANSVPVETKGKVVWTSPTTGGLYYGVEYTR